MKRLILSTLVVGLLGLGVTSSAAAQARGVAIVNVEAVLASIPEYRKNDSILGREYMTYQSNIQAMQAQFDKAKAEFDQKFVTLGQVARDAEMKKLQAKADSIQGTADSYRQKIGERREALLAPIEDRVTAVIEGLRAEGQYAVVLNVASDYNTIVAADKSIDLTLKAIERLKTPLDI